MADNKEEVEIDLLELGKKLWSKKKFIIKCSIIGAIVGIIIAFSIPKKYTTTVILTTEAGRANTGGMGALASMAGINLGGNVSLDIFSPDLYPEVLNSTPFTQGLLNIQVEDKSQEINSTLYEYIKNTDYPWWMYIIKAPQKLISSITADDLHDINANTDKKYYISKEEINIIEHLKESYNIKSNKTNGVITLEVFAQSPVISAFLADTLTNYLQSYVIEHRTRKANMDLSNSLKLFNQSKNEYYKLQDSLASFVDANKNVTSAKYRVKQEKLQSETNLAYSVYNQMAQQVQMAKIKVQDDTPVFTIIQPAVEPTFATSPQKKIILIGCVILSIMGSCIWTLKEDCMNILIR